MYYGLITLRGENIDERGFHTQLFAELEDLGQHLEEMFKFNDTIIIEKLDEAIKLMKDRNNVAGFNVMSTVSRVLWGYIDSGFEYIGHGFLNDSKQENYKKDKLSWPNPIEDIHKYL